MTLIATLAPALQPIAIGDLLLSGEGGNDRQVNIPTLGDVSQFFGDYGWGIRGLRQKVTIINDGLVVAWTGSLIGAGVLISTLRDRFKDRGTATPDALVETYKEIHELSKYPVSILGWLAVKDGFNQFFLGPGVSELDSPALGKILFAGSGSKAMHSVKKLWDLSNQTYFEGDMGIGLGAILTGFLLRAEREGGDSAPTLRQAFGGGYEIAQYSGGRFRKNPEITYLVWRAWLEGATAGIIVRMQPVFGLTQSYLDETLRIKSFSVASADGVNMMLTDRTLTAVYPMGLESKVLAVEDFADVPIDSNFQCHCILVNNHQIAVSLRRWQTREERELRFNFDGERYTLEYSDAFMQWLSGNAFQAVQIHDPKSLP